MMPKHSSVQQFSGCEHQTVTATLNKIVRILLIIGLTTIGCNIPMAAAQISDENKDD